MSATPPTVLLVDDRPNMLELLSKVLRHDARVLRARGAVEARQLLEREPISVVVSDLKMPDGDGLSVLDATRELRPYAAFILITAHASVANAVEAMRRGAYDYLTKPFEPEHVRALVLRALGAGECDHESKLVPVAPLPGMVGASRSMQAVMQLAREASQSRAPLAIVGESGTGRTMLARVIHELGVTQAGTLVETLAPDSSGAESEADLVDPQSRARAAGGTLLLHGAERAPVELSAQALRELRPSAPDELELRLIVLLTITPGEELAFPAWSELPTIQLPPLRERVGDVSRLANHFLGEVVGEEGPLGFTPTAMEMLERHPWPGNVRELAEAVRVASMLAAGRRIDTADLPQTIREAADEDASLALLSYQQAVDFARADATKRYLEAVLRRTGGVVSSAAEIAGIERESFYRLLRKHGVVVDDFRSGKKS